jgi:hypothetical protein
MKTSAALSSLRRFTLGTIVSALCAVPLTSDAAVSAGGLVVLGYTDNNVENSVGDDVIALVATETLSAGEVIYLTNNGWVNDSSTRAFSGADSTNQSGKGFEQITKLTINSTIFAGTVFRTNTTSAAYSWDTSSHIPTGNMASTDTFSALDLTFGSLGPYNYGDQIYIFQADGLPFPAPGAGINPLLHPTGFIHALNMGDQSGSPDTGFSNSYLGGSGGAVPDGNVSRFASGTPYDVVQGLDVASNDADLTNDYTAFEMDPGVFVNGSYHLNMSDPDVVALQTPGATKDLWLIVLSDSSNWTTGSLTGFSPTLNIVSGVPEPSRALLLFFGYTTMALRRRRQA